MGIEFLMSYGVKCLILRWIWWQNHCRNLIDDYLISMYNSCCKDLRQLEEDFPKYQMNAYTTVKVYVKGEEGMQI